MIRPDPLPDAALLLNAALEHHQQGDLATAENLFHQFLTLQPEDFTAIHQLGVIQSQRGQFQAAADLLDRALKLRPKSALAHFNLGMALQKLDRPEEALSHYQYSLAITPNNPDALLNCAVVLHGLQRDEEALSRLNRLLGMQGHIPEALLNKGIVLQNLHLLEEALVSLDELLALVPNHPEAVLNRGNVLMDLERPEEALEAFDLALSLRRDWADAMVNRGNALLILQRPQEALSSYGQVLAIKPDHLEALINQGNAFLKMGCPELALSDFDQALLIKADHVKALSTRSHALRHLHRYQEALESCDRALALDPYDEATHGNRGLVLLDLKRPLEALDCFQRALELQPRNAEVLVNLGTALHQLGRHQEAVDSLKKALTLRPTLAAAHSNLIFILDYLPELGFLEHQRARNTFYEAQAGALPMSKTDFSNDRNLSRRLVLGYVSADFKNHSAAACFGPVLKHHHQADFKIICYSEAVTEDEWTTEFRRHAEVWRNTLSYTDEELATQIREDEVDILIDLSGHSAGNRLMVFARKPAPIQVTAWGHGGGTGLPMMDYQFTDAVLVPVSVRALFTEESYDLPCCITFEAPAFIPEVKELPARSRGHVTFGSLNKFTKVTPAVLDVWARILTATPGSHLLIKDVSFDDWENRRKLLEFLSSYGIAAERIQLRGQTSRLKHFQAYDEVDIVLDTFPQNGGITTWEALWMGSPVIAKLGNQLSSRISGAILHALRLPEWVCENENEYYELAVQKAADISALSEFRQGIRERIMQSPAGNPELYTQAVEKAYRTMWKRWASQ